MHEGIKDHKCVQCNRTFSQLRDMKEHMSVVHEGVKRFQCDMCELACGRARDLKLHKMRVHEGKKLTLRQFRNGVRI